MPHPFLSRPARTLAAALIAAGVVPALVVAGTAPADASVQKSGAICQHLDSGRQVVKEKSESVVVRAPKGMLIGAYCVGSAEFKGTTGAPYYVKLEKPLAELVLSHRDGGRLTQYSLLYVSAGDAEPVDEPPVRGPVAAPFSWDWTYDAPSCTALTVDYPRNIPGDQANDVNVRVRTDRGEVVVNFHNNDDFWTGKTQFTFSQHPNWPRDVKEYAVTWVQVGGTNYHWQGDVSCRTDGDAKTVDLPKEVTEIEGYRTGEVKVARDQRASDDVIRVDAEGLEPTMLQLSTGKEWRDVSTVATDREGRATVRYPKLTKAGVYRFRLAVAGTESVTGATTALLTARVR